MTITNKLPLSKSWEGQPLIDIPTVVNLIGSTRTKEGLTVKCVVDNNEYPTGIKVTDEEYAKIDIERLTDMKDWNYIVRGFRKE